MPRSVIDHTTSIQIVACIGILVHHRNSIPNKSICLFLTKLKQNSLERPKPQLGVTNRMNFLFAGAAFPPRCCSESKKRRFPRTVKFPRQSREKMSMERCLRHSVHEVMTSINKCMSKCSFSDGIWGYTCDIFQHSHLITRLSQRGSWSLVTLLLLISRRQTK